MVASLLPKLALAAAWIPWPSGGSEDGTSVVVAAPPTSGESPLYSGHRAPLLPDPLLKLPIGAVRPRGWLAEQVERTASGMFGRLPEFSHWVRPATSAWRSKDGQGENGWEELPYWLKGLTSLAFLVDGSDDASAGGPTPDPKLRSLAIEWLEAILASQREDGWFGPESNRAPPDLWPNMPVLWAMRTWHEATGDPRILDFLARYFRYVGKLPPEMLLPDSWQKVRGGDLLEIVHWLHDREGGDGLLALAQRIHERTADWTSGVASWHGVNICQGFREPLQFFAQSHDPRHRDATSRDYAEVMAKYGQVPGGMFGADENCREGRGDPRQGAEACSMVEFMASFELLGARTGETIWFDRCEEVAFNSLPAAMDAELASLHYLTAPNLVSCDARNHAPGFENSGCMLAFSPDERYRCCQHDVVQGWPRFVEHLWFATRDRGLAAALHAPCRVSARVGDRRSVELDVVTDYPASDTVVVQARMDPGTSASFPIYLRIPGWCDRARVDVGSGPTRVPDSAGRWVRCERAWKNGDRVVLELPMRVRVRRFEGNHGAASIERGPLAYALQPAEEWRRLDGEDPPRSWEVTTRDRWNFGLVLGPEEDPVSTIGVFQSANWSFDAEREPWRRPFLSLDVRRLTVKARRIPAWQLDWTGLVAPLQPGPVKSSEPIEELRLVPMGCARLRIAAFPVIGSGPDAHEWTPPRMPLQSSHAHDDPFALDDGVLPKSSHDQGVPRFTFWDHLGTVEWIEREIPEDRTVSRCGVYWFDDTGSGRCRVPKSWRLLVRSDDGPWSPVPLAGSSAFGVELDRMNEVLFEPIAGARELRLEVALQPGFSTGLFEWTMEE
jgi:hypothetical protein